MPTGYTNPVRKGEITDLRQFIEACAHAVIPAMYDRPMSTPIPTSVSPGEGEIDHLERYRRELDALRLELRNYRLWTYAEAEADQDRSFHKALEEWRESERKRLEDLARYEAMLAQVKAWQVTTPIQGLKDFMIEQLESSIKFDCSPSDWAKPIYRTPDEHKAKKIEGVKRSIKYAEQHVADEIERRERNQAWLDEFWKVLPKA